MVRITMIALVGLVLGCSKDPIDAFLDEMASFKGKACACKDAACGEKVRKQLFAWMSTQKDMKDKKPSAAQEKRGKELFDGMEKCREKLEGGDGEDEAGEIKAMNEKLAAEAAAGASAAQAEVEALQRKVMELDAQLAAAIDAVAAAQNDAERSAAKAKLDALRPQQAELQAQLAEAKSTAARAERLKGVKVTKECLENPLAAGC